MNKLPEPPPLIILRILALLVVGVMVALALWFAKVPETCGKELSFNRLFLRAESRNEVEYYLQITKGEYLLPYAPPYLITGEVYGTLIDCLVHHESKGYKWAKGAAGEKGILQFMPATFKHFCVEKYGFPNQIWDTEIQRACCDKMLAEGKAYLWTTIKYCD